MTATIEAAYSGIHGIRIGDRLYSFSSNEGGIITQAARQAIRDGMDPKALVQVTRNGTKVFHNATLGYWAGLTVSEEDGRSARLKRYRPHSSERTKASNGGEAGQEVPKIILLPLTSAMDVPILLGQEPPTDSDRSDLVSPEGELTRTPLYAGAEPFASSSNRSSL